MIAFLVAIGRSSAVAAVYSNPYSLEPTAIIDIVSNVFAVKKEEEGDDTQQAKDRISRSQGRKKHEHSQRTLCTTLGCKFETGKLETCWHYGSVARLY